jgi:hypothetical protein
MSEWLHICFISDGSARGALEQLAYGDKPGLNLNNIRVLLIPYPHSPNNAGSWAKWNN